MPAYTQIQTQYGNILRVRPDDERSPLLQPENQHKQLIVIDFEYASANLPGLEFANHFTEWAYNYHDERASYACAVERSYPTAEEQQRFVRAYVEHRPKIVSNSSNSASAASSSTSLPAGATDSDVTPSATPLLAATPSSSSIVEFMLDARVPPGGWKEEERRAAALGDEQINELLRETRLWRAMNSAQWVAWGIVQAKIPGYTDGDSEGSDEARRVQQPPSPVGSEGTVKGDSINDISNNGSGSVAGDENAAGGAEEEEEGFDYLSYAHERALFFWGDCVQMGLARLEELPEGLRERVKVVEH